MVTQACVQGVDCTWQYSGSVAVAIHGVLHISDPVGKGWKAESAQLADLLWTVYRQSGHLSAMYQMQVCDRLPANDRHANHRAMLPVCPISAARRNPSSSAWSLVQVFSLFRGYFFQYWIVEISLIG